MTHDELIARVMRWLRNSKRHTVVLAEIGSDGRELPDVIAWNYRSHCTVVECKVSRADFKRDEKKFFRRVSEQGMGEYRWYATPPDLIEARELPPSWGLIEVGKTHVRTCRQPSTFSEHNTRGETACLISAVQRATESWGRKVFGEISPVHGQLDPHPSVARVIKDMRDENRSLRDKLARREAALRVQDLLIRSSAP